MKIAVAVGLTLLALPSIGRAQVIVGTLHTSDPGGMPAIVVGTDPGRVTVPLVLDRFFTDGRLAALNGAQVRLFGEDVPVDGDGSLLGFRPTSPLVSVAGDLFCLQGAPQIHFLHWKGGSVPLLNPFGALSCTGQGWITGELHHQPGVIPPVLAVDIVSKVAPLPRAHPEGSGYWEDHGVDVADLFRRLEAAGGPGWMGMLDGSQVSRYAQTIVADAAGGAGREGSSGGQAR